MELWYDYRRAWAAHPWLLVYAVVVLAILALAIVGTLGRNLLAILFIPSLAGLYVHHLLVMKRIS